MRDRRVGLGHDWPPGPAAALTWHSARPNLPPPDQECALLRRVTIRLGCIRLAAVPLLLLADSAHAETIKPPLTGLISMGPGGYTARNSNARFPGVPGTSLEDIIAKRNAFDGVVINVPWAQLQPEPGDGLHTEAIDTALADIRRYNADPQTQTKLRAILRIWAGETAPAWAKTLDGPPVTVYNGTRDHYRSFTIGRVWTPAYQTAWRGLQARLAARYDREPLIAQIANTSCTTADDEPDALARFNSAADGVSSVRNLHEAGFTDAAFDRCMTGSIHDYDAWATTPVNVDIGPLFRLDNAPDYAWPQRDSAFAIRLIAQWRAALGPRSVLANHTLNYPLNPLSREVYEAIHAAGGQIEFQTHSPRTLDWANTVKEAVCLGAHSLELWNSTGAGGYVDFPTATLIAWSNTLKHTSSNDLCPNGA
jgi:hypothetical protein